MQRNSKRPHHPTEEQDSSMCADGSGRPPLAKERNCEHPSFHVGGRLAEVLTAQFMQEVPALGMLREVCIFEERLEAATYRRAEQISHLLFDPTHVDHTHNGVATRSIPAAYCLTLTAYLSLEASTAVTEHGFTDPVYDLMLEASSVEDDAPDSDMPTNVDEGEAGDRRSIRKNSLAPCLFSVLDEVRILQSSGQTMDPRENVLASWRRIVEQDAAHATPRHEQGTRGRILGSCAMKAATLHATPSTKHTLYFPQVRLPDNNSRFTKPGNVNGERDTEEKNTQLILEFFPCLQQDGPNEKYVFIQPNAAEQYGIHQPFTRFELVQRIKETNLSDYAHNQGDHPSTCRGSAFLPINILPPNENGVDILSEEERLVVSLSLANRILRNQCKRYQPTNTTTFRRHIPRPTTSTSILFHSIMEFPWGMAVMGARVGMGSASPRLRLHGALKKYESEHFASLSELRRRCEELEQQLIDCLALQTKYAQFAANPLLEIHNALVVSYAEDIVQEGTLNQHNGGK